MKIEHKAPIYTTLTVLQRKEWDQNAIVVVMAVPAMQAEKNSSIPEQ